MSFLEAPATILFSLFYFLVTLGFVLQSREFSSAGITPENLLSTFFWLDQSSEDLRFLHFHIKKTAGTLIIHSAIPLVYLLCYSYFTTVVDGNYSSIGDFWTNWPSMVTGIATASLALALVASTAYYWSLNNWQKHPYVQKIKQYCVNNTWTDVAADIDTEFRRIDKLIIRTSALVKVVVTDNWLILVGQWPWNFQVAHQSDITLELTESEQHYISPDGQAGGAQYLTITVKNRRPDMPSFKFRLNATEYDNLAHKVRGPIANVRNVKIYKSVSDRFVEVFKENVEMNPRATDVEEVDSCIGCMVNPANIKLTRRCTTARPEPHNDVCRTCYCRPMWCLTCLAKWFAMRQKSNEPEIWLGSKCPCPTCRSTFCVLDVSIIEGARVQDMLTEDAQE